MATTSLADAQAHLAELVAAAQRTHERTTITWAGRPAAVLLSAEDFGTLMATLELLSDPEALAALEESRIADEHGLAYTRDETWDGDRLRSPAESEQRLIDRLGRGTYDRARAASRAELLRHPDANVRERAKDYGPTSE